MRAEDVELIPTCSGCLLPWLPGDDERWVAYITAVGLVFVCPSCAALADENE